MAPTGSRFLLDTNIIIALMEGDETVLANLDRVDEVFIPSIALGELFPAESFSRAIWRLPARTER